jgi:porphyrinogen peroxidase
MKVPHLSEQLDDIQGMLGTGYGWLYSSRFWLLTIRDGRENDARKWLAGFVRDGLVVSVADVRKSRTHPVEKAVAIAFSYSGIVKLGCKETEAHPFPSPFQSGMGSELRELLLRDRPRKWRWSDVDGTDCVPVHVLIAEWATRDAEPLVSDIDKEVFGIIKIDNDPYAFQKGKGDTKEKLREAFGFRDGLAQPVIRGLREDQGAALKQAIREAGPLYDDRVVAPGEFILGYRNEYDELTYCPNVEGWTGDARHTDGRFGLNGSYMAVRQIEQNVKAFEDFRTAKGQAICEKLMGRQKTGLPLSWKGAPNASVSDSKADAFRFRVDDANGFDCPKGAHIRRVNPRDSLGVDVKSSTKLRAKASSSSRAMQISSGSSSSFTSAGCATLVSAVSTTRTIRSWGRRPLPRRSPFRDWRAARRFPWKLLRKLWEAATSSFRESRRSDSSWSTSHLRKQSWHRPPLMPLCLPGHHPTS